MTKGNTVRGDCLWQLSVSDNILRHFVRCLVWPYVPKISKLLSFQKDIGTVSSNERYESIGATSGLGWSMRSLRNFFSIFLVSWYVRDRSLSSWPISLSRNRVKIYQYRAAVTMSLQSRTSTSKVPAFTLTTGVIIFSADGVTLFPGDWNVLFECFSSNDERLLLRV